MGKGRLRNSPQTPNPGIWNHGCTGRWSIWKPPLEPPISENWECGCRCHSKAVKVTYFLKNIGVWGSPTGTPKPWILWSGMPAWLSLKNTWYMSVRIEKLNFIRSPDTHVCETGCSLDRPRRIHYIWSWKIKVSPLTKAITTSVSGRGYRRRLQWREKARIP